MTPARFKLGSSEKNASSLTTLAPVISLVQLACCYLFFFIYVVHSINLCLRLQVSPIFSTLSSICALVHVPSISHLTSVPLLEHDPHLAGIVVGRKKRRRGVAVIKKVSDVFSKRDQSRVSDRSFYVCVDENDCYWSYDSIIQNNDTLIRNYTGIQ